ncbi:hypothetical protein COC69_05860 [Bacillus cereus]|uniref:DUF669 domain-containing protein n=1 Tax=Bacillus cereus TaxID=1396 RepID=A0A9X7GX87_BACCE|nr:DUF669 domain-containing protein [Bacillus cereus]PGS81654.1 hypothetical protein COC69_05860 [Bacillus cereus]
MFEIDYSKAQEFGNIADGTYETLIEFSMEKTTPSGADYLSIPLRVRTDFEQPHKNSLIFYKIWQKKEDGKYPQGSIMNLAKMSGIPDGTKFKDLDAYLTMLEGKALKVTVKNESSEYNGKTYENLNVKKIEISNLPPVSGSGSPMEISDSDLPF